MSAKRQRFDYLKTQDLKEQASETSEVQMTSGGAALESVPRGRGRMQQDREQLNVRIPTQLKRRAAAKAALEGQTVGEVIEHLLRQYVEAT